MFISGLQLTDFRSHAQTELDFSPGPVAFIGSNGYGKTNIVEAIDYLATMDSHRVSSSAPLVRMGAESAIIRATVVKSDRPALIEIQVNPGRANQVRVNQSPLPRPRELIGKVRTVLYSPEDLTLVKGDPGDRRRFLDALAIMDKPRIAGVKADYERVLRQRNTLLKTARQRRQVDLSTLDIWDDNLVRLGAELTAARLRLLDAMEPFVTQAYAGLAADAATGRQRVTLTYKPAVEDVAAEREVEAIAATLADAVAQRRAEELDRGVSLVGPHRDEIVFSIGDFPAKGYASHGESWSLALALKLGSFELLRQDGDDPILILDDVFAELDEARRSHLVRKIASAEQVFITAAVADDVPQELAADRFMVTPGEVTHVGS